MDEGANKPIPLRRTRGSARTPAPRSTSWTAAVTGGVRRVFEPTRQVWLAGLGSTAITLRGAREIWSLLVSEGAATESWLRGTVWSRNGNGTNG